MTSNNGTFSRTRLKSLAAVILLSGIVGSGMISLALADGGDQGYRYSQNYAQNTDQNNGSWTTPWRGREAAQRQYQPQPYYRQANDYNRQPSYSQQEDNNRQPEYRQRSTGDQRNGDN